MDVQGIFKLVLMIVEDCSVGICFIMYFQAWKRDDIGVETPGGVVSRGIIRTELIDINFICMTYAPFSYDSTNTLDENGGLRK